MYLCAKNITIATKNSMVANIIIVSSAPASAKAIDPYLDKRYSLIKAMPAQSRIRVDKWVLNSLYNQGRTNDIDNLDKLPCGYTLTVF